MGGSAITEKDPKATTDRIPRRTRHPMVRAHRCIFAPPENPVPAKIFDLPIHGLRQAPPSPGWLPEFRKKRQAFPRKVLRNWDLRRRRSGIVAEIVECVPNFSEGRRKEVVDEIARSIASVPGVRVLDTEMDPDHNRSVITFIGDRAGVADPDRKPDFGPSRLHPTAGACIVGARPVLIAWNVNLGTKDVAIAKRIAKAIRESDGGLPAVRAKGFELADRGLVQVSMNMTDYQKTSLVQAFEAIRELATKEHVEIVESEIIGLVPLDAVLVGATQYFKLARFHREQVLEARLWE